jgi:DNA (cytosine-5)-methyltransferase 1
VALPSPVGTGEQLAGLSLCAGYGGLDLGLHIAEPAYRTVCYVEREAHAAATLVARMEDAALAQAPVWSDLRSFDGKPWRSRIHILSAGYPCQPFTYSGQRKGEDDPRHLWPQVARIIGEIEPEWVFLENVEGHVTLGLATVAGELAGLGYMAKAGLFTAREVGGSHGRRRIFILAHTNRIGQRPLSGYIVAPGQIVGDQEPCADAFKRRADTAAECGAELDAAVDGDAGAGVARRDGEIPLFAPGPAELQEWERLLSKHPRLQPAILRADDGMADRLDRTRAAGNGVCSMAAAVAYSTLKADFEREWRAA